MRIGCGIVIKTSSVDESSGYYWTLGLDAVGGEECGVAEEVDR